MCHAVTCSTCGKVTWEGCGQHVDQVMADVPEGDRCLGHADQSEAGHTDQRGGWLGRVFGRR